MKVLFWHVLLEIKRPEEKTAGGIILTEDLKDAEAMLTMVGKVVALGPMAYKTNTSANGGHDYKVHANDVGEGAWVLTSRKIGVPIKYKDGRIYQLCNDYEILSVLTEEEAAQIKAYV